MTWYPAYLSDKTEIVDWAKDQRPDLNENMVPDVTTRMADTMVWMRLADEDISVDYTGTISGSADPNPADINGFLWAASLCFNLEILSMRGTIHYTHGGIQKTVIGQVTTEFMRQQPMFFLGKGREQLDDVLTFRTFKQLGQQFIDAWIKIYLRNRDGSLFAIPQIGYDETSRGYGWNAGDSFRSFADGRSSGLRNL